MTIAQRRAKAKKLEKLLDMAAGLNENYRVEQGDRAEVGFLYGTAEMVLMLYGLGKTESYSDRREEIAVEIDQRAAKKTYALITKSRYL